MTLVLDASVVVKWFVEEERTREARALHQLFRPGQECPRIGGMTGDEFLRRLGRERGVAVRCDGKPGKGSHGRVSYGSRFTTLKDPRKEIGSGLLAKILRDLGLTRADLT